MFECLIVGDSIAVGVSRQLPKCHRQAIGGVSSAKYAKAYTRKLDAKRTLISIGSNDLATVDSYADMKLIRSRVTGKVTWLLSANKPKANETARRVAKENGDDVLEIKPYVGKDGVHPTAANYKKIATDWK